MKGRARRRVNGAAALTTEQETELLIGPSPNPRRRAFASEADARAAWKLTHGRVPFPWADHYAQPVYTASRGA